LTESGKEGDEMLILNGKIITWEEENRILEGQAILIKDGLITQIGPQRELMDLFPQETRLDARAQFVMPGNICAHTHFYGAYARGMAIPGESPKNFPEILQRLWWPLDMALDRYAVRSSALVMLVEAIKHGTTTLIDHHASPNFIDGSLDVIAESVKEAGLRGVLCYEVTDRNGMEGAEAGINENIHFLESLNKEESGLLSGSFGIHASLSVSDKTLEACRKSLPSDTGVHIHVAEDGSDQDDSKIKSGMRVVERLQRHQLLGPKSIAVHAVHVDAKEMSILADTGTWVTHQPRSNMNNAVGTANVEDMLRIGIPVCIGTDGFMSTMWSEWKMTYLVHKLWNRDPRKMNGSDVVRMGVYNNSALASMFFQEAALGKIVPGAYADLIFVDYQPFTPITNGNLPWHILFGFHESMVTTTIVNGKVLMRDRQLLTLDEERIISEALGLAPEIWSRYEGYVGMYSD
jgi:putative selenium metabolism protein SsnA